MQDVTAQVLSPHSAQPFPHPSPPEGIIILMLIVSFTCVFHLYYFCNYLMALKILCFKNTNGGHAVCIVLPFQLNDVILDFDLGQHINCIITCSFVCLYQKLLNFDVTHQLAQFLFVYFSSYVVCLLKHVICMCIIHSSSLIRYCVCESLWK